MALPVAYWVSRRGESSSGTLILTYHIIGLMLVSAVSIMGFFSAPTAFQKLHLSIDNSHIAQWPWVWLPTVMVPAAFLMHLSGLRRWASQRTAT